VRSVLVRGSPEPEHESLHGRTTRTTAHPQCHGGVGAYPLDDRIVDTMASVG